MINMIKTIRIKFLEESLKSNIPIINLLHTFFRNVQKSSLVSTPSNKGKFVVPEGFAGFSTPTKKNRVSLKGIPPSNLLTSLNLKLQEEMNKSKEDSEFFDYEDEKKEDLTSEEKFVYGMREPKEYKKIKLLGK